MSEVEDDEERQVMLHLMETMQQNQLKHQSNRLHNLQQPTNAQANPSSSNRSPTKQAASSEQREEDPASPKGEKGGISTHPFFTNHPRLQNIKRPSSSRLPQQQTNTKPPGISTPPRTHQTTGTTSSTNPSTTTNVRRVPAENKPTTSLEHEDHLESAVGVSRLVPQTNLPPTANMGALNLSDDGTIVEMCASSVTSISQARNIIVSRDLTANENSLLRLLSNVKLLNLHQNYIVKIESLTEFVNIQELNLSSNNIDKIEGLNTLESLKVLNLASNKISKIEGLGDLKQLRKLILSYNRISSLEGFSFLHGPQFNLRYLDLRGNCIESLNELTFLFGLNHIRELHFQNGIDGSLGNPVCKHDRYRPIILSRLSLQPTQGSNSGSLEILDGFRISIVREQSQPSKRQIILNYQNKQADSDEFDENETLSSPYVSKYMKYLKNNLSDTSLDPIPSGNIPSKGVLKIEVPSKLAEAQDDLSSLESPPQSSSGSIQTLSQFVGLRKSPGKKESKRREASYGSADNSVDSLDENYSSCTETSSDEESRGRRRKSPGRNSSNKVNAGSSPSTPNTIQRIHVRDENSQTDLSSKLVDEMMRLRSINLFDASCQTDVESDIPKISIDESQLSDNSTVSSTKSERDGKLIADLRKTIEDLCKEIGSSNVYIQHREQELATEVAKRRKLEEELCNARANFLKYKKKLAEFQERFATVSEENIVLKEHDAQLQKEIERTKSDAYSLAESKEKSISSIQKEYEAIINALKKKIDHLSKNNTDIMDILKKSKEEQTKLQSLFKSDMKKVVEEYEKKITELKEQLQKEKLALIDSHSSTIRELQSKHEDQQQEILATKQQKLNEMEISMKEMTEQARDYKTTLSDYVKREMRYTKENDDLKKLVQKQKEKLGELLQSKQDNVSKLSTQLEEVKSETSTKDRIFKKEIEKLSTLGVNYKNHMEQQRLQIEDLTRIKQELTLKIEEVLKEAGNAYSDLELLKKDRDEKEQSLRLEFEKKVQTIRDDFVKDQEAALRVKNTMLLDNNETIKKQKEELNKVKDRVAFLEKELDREIKEKENFIKTEDRRDDYIEKLEREIEEAVEMAKKEKAKRQHCRDDLNASLEEINNLKDQLRSVNDQYYLIQDQLNLSLKNLDKEKQHNKELTLQLSRVETDLVESSQNTKKRLSALENLNNELVTKLKAVSDKKKQYAQHIIELEENQGLLKRALKKQQDIRQEAEDKLVKFKAFMKELGD